MGRPKGGTNVSHSKEEKLALVLRNLAGETTLSLERDRLVFPKKCGSNVPIPPIANRQLTLQFQLYHDF